MLFLLSAVLGVWPAYDRSLCWSTLIALAAGFLWYVSISRLAVPHGQWRAIAGFITLVSMSLSLYFITQYAHLGYPEKVGVISRLGPLIGKAVPPVATWKPHPNSVAMFLEGVLFLAVGLALSGKRATWRTVGAVGAGLIALALLMSASRGAWLAVSVAAGLWLALYWRPARVVMIAGGVLSLGLVVYVIARGDITVLGDIPIVDRVLAPIFIRPDRLEVYRNSIYLIQDFPLSGIGLGKQFAMVYAHYALLIQHPFLTYSHNLYLEAWLQQGLFGIAALLWLLLSLYQAARTHAKPNPDPLYQSTWIGLTATFVHGISDAPLYVDLWCWIPLFGLLGLNAAVVLHRSSLRPQGLDWLFPVGAVCAFLLIVLISLSPLSATWHANQGCILHARGDLLESLDDGQRATLRRQAMAHYRRAIQSNPRDRTAQQRLGLILVDEARFQEGVEHLEIARQAAPSNTTTRKALGLAYVWVGELEKAEPLLQDVPDIVEELNVWAWWRDTQQQMEQSVNAYRMSLLLDPNQPKIRERLDQLEEEIAP